MSDATTYDETDQLPALLATPQSLAVGMARAEIDQQITTARAYPRSIKQVTDRIFSLATLDAESAQECMYALPRGKGADAKAITGPSIRFAEVVKQSYGNCRAAARVVHVDREEKYVEAEGVFHDLETNVATTARVRRRISTSKGYLFSDDMIIVTGNAACSIALRNAIMGGIPKPLWRRAFEAVESTIKGDLTTLSENRQNAMKAFAIFGVKPEQVFTALGLAGGEDITVEHIPLLRGMFSALKSGEETVESMFSANLAPGASPQALHAGFEDERKSPAQAKEAVATKRAGRAKAAEKPQEADSGPKPEDAAPKAEATVGDVLSDDDLPEALRGARPTETASAQTADAGQDTSDSATDASSDTAEETSGPAPSDAEVHDGHAEPGEVYLMADVPALEDGRRITFKDGARFSSVGPKGIADLKVYDEHAPEVVAEGEAEDDDAAAPGPAMLAYIVAIKAAADFQSVKRALAELQKTDEWKAMTPDETDDVRWNTWDTMVQTGVAQGLKVSEDVSAFRLWLEYEEDPEVIEKGLADLEDHPDFKSKPEGLKETIRGAAQAKLKSLEPEG